MFISRIQQTNKIIKCTAMCVLVVTLVFTRLASGESEGKGEWDATPGHGCSIQNGTVHDMLTFIARTENTKILVFKRDESILYRGVSFALIGPISPKNAMKVLRAILLTEGFELVAEGESLALKRILTEEQTIELKESLGLRSDPESKPLARRRVIQNEDEDKAPADLIILREDKETNEHPSPDNRRSK